MPTCAWCGIEFSDKGLEFHSKLCHHKPLPQPKHTQPPAYTRPHLFSPPKDPLASEPSYLAQQHQHQHIMKKQQPQQHPTTTTVPLSAIHKHQLDASALALEDSICETQALRS
eukprot:PhF_6_TR23067/c0_g1_i1/m.32516